MNQNKTWGSAVFNSGPTVFFVYINDLPKTIEQNAIPISLTDDTGILITSQNNIQFPNYLNIVFC
jgi:hypothetical protein